MSGRERPEPDPHEKSRVAREVVKVQREQQERAKWQTEEAGLFLRYPVPGQYFPYSMVEAGVPDFDNELFTDGGIREYILTHVRRGRSFRILDFGCGKFELANDLRKFYSPQEVALTGTSIGDPRSDEQKIRHRQRGVEFISSDVSPLPKLMSEGRHFDLIVSRLLLMHVVHPLRQIERLYALLAVGGELRCDFNARILLCSVQSTNEKREITLIHNMFKSLEGSQIAVTVTDEHIFLKKREGAPDTISFSRWYTLKNPKVFKRQSAFGDRVRLYKLRDGSRS